MSTSFALPTTNGVDSISGLDLNSLINNLVNIEQAKVTNVQNEKSKDQVKIQAYSQLRSLLQNIQDKAATLSDTTSFDLFSASSTKSDAVTIEGSSGATEGQYDVKVFQLAANEKMISADNRITSQSATLASQGVHVGQISIGGVTVTIDASDTIQDLRAKINATTDADGNHAPVTASVMKMSNSDFRLVLASKTTGSAGVAYKDLTGSTLQDLGIITTADGQKGSLAQQLQSSDDLASAWNSLAAGTAVHLEGMDHNGLAVSATFIKNAGATADDFVKKVSAAFHDTATVAVDANGLLTVTDKTAGGSQLTMSKMTFGDTAHAAGVVQGGQEGAGVLTVGKDAYLSVDSMSLHSSDNSVSGFDAGSTLNLHAVTGDAAATVALTRDATSIESKLKDILDGYNQLVDFAKKETQMADPSDSTTSDGDLAGDMTVSSIVDSVRQSFGKQYNLFGGNLTSFAMIGVQTDSQTGHLSVDDKKFQKAVDTDLEGVMRLFVTTGISPENQNISLGLNTNDTKSGAYELQELDAQRVQIRLRGTNQWYTSSSRVGDVVTFATGPAKGMTLSVPQGSLSGTTPFVLQKGLSTALKEAISNLTKTDNGVVTIQENSLQDAMQDADKRIVDLQTRVEAYRTRLINQFSQMETTLANLKQQSARITQSLG